MLPLASSMAPLPFPTLCFGQPGKASRTRHRLPSAGIPAGPCSAGPAPLLRVCVCGPCVSPICLKFSTTTLQPHQLKQAAGVKS